ncbi:hypothetical protein SERLADRAFT_458570 [Serpula lacrymans var. lacrymans S7.9]|uniref:Uncharacterized protein n=1 Tax=Serpula lacrymans var. lacrymans (strain S7.9) TaxID=578457 RepID=F8NJL6_SERL9|nr:uncharacterized protein SERLADRAFT_458570 [Serpula lacrymans var. lacrymans S7.9]EGO30066.1 hypothetical protein SERLADRAFT_458570 [Serpula lacrymans var. lacrymans S7.9]
MHQGFFTHNHTSSRKNKIYCHIQEVVGGRSLRFGTRFHPHLVPNTKIVERTSRTS